MIGPMYKTKLEHDGHVVTWIDNGGDGLAEAKKGGYNIILLDVIMPQLDGFSVLTELRADKKTAKTPIVMLTSLGTDEDVEKAKKMGADDYIIKGSITPTDVSAKVTQILNKKSK